MKHITEKRDVLGAVDSVSAFLQKYVTSGLLPYFWLAILSALLSAIAVYSVYIDVLSPTTIQLLGAVFTIGVVAVAVWLKFIDRLTTKKLIFLAILCGFILRVTYVAYSTVTMRQHDTDVYYTYDVITNGHFGYIMTIYSTGKLPVTNDYQAYHPPLMHLLCALGIWIGNEFNIQLKLICELLQILPLFFTSSTTIIMTKIIKRMKLSEPMTVIAVLLTVFQPHGIILAGSINNDALMWLFFCISILYLMKWNEDTTMKNIVVIALSLGLGMMTKMSAALMIPIIAAVFIYKFVKNFKTSASNYYPQFTAFLLTSVPIGMWYPIRNYILFGQSFNYVPALGTDRLIYKGDFSLAERFGIDFAEFFQGPFLLNFDKNIWMILAKTASFDETCYGLFSWSAEIVVIINIIFIVVTIPAMVHVFTKERGFNYCVLGSIWFVLIASFIKFCFDFPYLSTSSFRYIYPTAMIGAIFIARSCELIKKRCKWISFVYGIIACTFVVCTCVTYFSPFMTK